MKRALQIVVFVLSIVQVSFGRNFANINVERGLSSNTVSSICQDSLGRIWMATKGGVNRYDGYDVTVFRHDDCDPRTIQSNLVNEVYLAPDGAVWACTADGVARYDMTLGRFVPLQIEGVRSVENMTHLAGTEYLLCTRNNSIIYDMYNGRAHEMKVDGKSYVIYDILDRDGSEFSLATSSGTLETFTYSSENGFCRKYGAVSGFGGSITEMIYAPDSGIWAGTNKGELLLCSLADSSFTSIALPGFSPQRVEALQMSAEGRLWIGTKTGIALYDADTEECTRIVHDPYDKRSLSSDAVRCIFRDRDGNMWVGSSYGGLDMAAGREDCFRILHKHPESSRSLSDDIIRSLGVDEGGRVWIGTRYNGLNCYDPSSGEVRVLDGISHILCLNFHEGGIYAGTYRGGVVDVDPVTGRMTRLTRKIDVNAIEPAAHGCYWIASLSGLYLFDPAAGKAMQRVKTAQGGRFFRVMSLLTDSEGHLWVGSKESLQVMRVGPDNTLSDVTPASLKNIVRAQVLFQDTAGAVWIGTSDGLLRYSGGALARASHSSGLANANISGIVQDDSLRLWVSTDNALCRYDPCVGEGRLLRSGRGLCSDQFNVGAICRGADGTIYVGGSKGVTYFHPEDLDEASPAVVPYISAIYVHNEQVHPGDDSGVLSAEAALTREIILRHWQDSFTLHFTCPDYSSSGSNTFEYMLEGFDHGWMHTDAQAGSASREVTYTNLPGGKYTFRLRAASSDGLWAPDEAVLEIRIVPVWYKSPAFKIIAILLLVLLLVELMVSVVNRILRRNHREMEMMKGEYEGKLRQARLKDYIGGRVSNLSAEDEDFVLTLLARIEAGVSNPQFSVEGLAAGMCMSRSNLHLRVKSLTGSSPMDLVKRIRMEKACALLRGGELSVAQIAQEAGFSSASYFSSAFKKEFGLSPGEFARKTGRNA